MLKRTKLAKSLLIAFGGAASIHGGMAVAQTAPAPAQTLERVEITGSRIRSIDLETSQPILKLTKEDIQKSGLVTAGDIINSLTTSGTPAFSKGSTLTSNREQGGQYADMRNLGAQRVLVLVDGKRWTTSINGYTDISTIPSALIERVEILKDGASSVYGSDAIAGVINFILKRRFTGGEASVYYGANEKGDGRNQQYDFTYGAQDEKSSIVVNLSLSKTGVVWAKDRDITASSYGPADYAFGAGFGASPWGRYRYVNPTTGNVLAGSPNVILNHTGAYLGDGVGANSRDPASYHTYAGAQADTFNSSSQMMFQSPSDLKSLFVKGDYDIASNLRFKMTAQYSERDSSAQNAGYPMNSFSQPTYPVYVDKDSYYNPLGSSVAGAGNGRDLFFYRRTIEVPRVTDNNVKALHLDAGLEGDFKIGANDWNWDVGVNYNRMAGTVNGTGNLNLLALKKALGPSFLNSSGVVQCGTAAAPISLTQCTPFNILGGPSASTQAALDYVMAKTTATFGSTITSFTANATGSVAKLPAGDLGLAFGAEYRKVAGYDKPDTLAGQGLTTDLAGFGTDASSDIKELYGELNVPILKDMPGAQMLNLSLASRYSKYSNFGSTTNSKVGLVYKPINDLLVRGTWAQGFRAPTLGDTFGGGQQSFDVYLDPCDTAYGDAKTNAAVAARCAAAGVPANFRQVNQAGTPVTAATQGTSPFNAGAGNADLKPETATTTTVGFVFSPAQVPGLSTSIDWWRIDIKHAITALGAGDVLNYCYVNNDPTYCASIVRDPSTGMVTSLDRGNVNAGGYLTEGIDVNVTYAFPKQSWGALKATFDGTYLTKYDYKSSDTADWVSQTGEWPQYRIKANLALDWSRGDWSARFMTRYYGAVKDQCWDTGDASGAGSTECTDPLATAGSWGTGINKRHAVIYNDLNVGYKTPWKGTIMVGVNNVFDVKPRIMIQAGSANPNGTGTSSSSSVDSNLDIDRFFYLRYTQSF